MLQLRMLWLGSKAVCETYPAALVPNCVDGQMHALTADQIGEALLRANGKELDGKAEEKRRVRRRARRAKRKQDAKARDASRLNRLCRYTCLKRLAEARGPRTPLTSSEFVSL